MLLAEAQNTILEVAQNIFEQQSLTPTQASAAAQTFLFGGAQGTAYEASNIVSSLWGQASNTFASSLSGDITVIGTSLQANAGATLGVVELPALLSNPNITSVGGVAIADLESAGANAFSMILNQFSNVVSNGGVFAAANGTGGVLSQEAFSALGYTVSSASTAAELAAQGLANVAINAAEATAADILSVAGGVALGLLSGAVGGAITNILTSATPANANEDEIARQNNFTSDLPSGDGLSTVVTNPDGSSSVSIPLYNPDGSFASNFVLNVNPGQTAVTGAATYGAAASGGIDTTTSLFNSAAGTSPVGQVTSAPDANGDGGSSLRFATPEEQATLTGTSIDPTQVTPNANGSFTFGSPQADPNGLVNQLNVNGTFGINTLSVTNPVTGAVDTVPLSNGSTSDVQEGRSAATGTPNEQVQSTNSDGSQADAIFGQGAQANVSNTAVTLAPGAQAAVNGNNNAVDDTDDNAPVQEGRSVAIDGTGNSYQGQAGDSAQVSGTGNATSDVSTVTLVGDGSSATTTGASAVALTASDQTETADPGSVVTVSPDLTGEAINGSGLTVDADGLMLGNLVGNNDVLNDTDNGGTYYGIYGTGNTINATNDGFVDAQSGTLTLQGSGNTLSALASGDTIDAAAGNTVSFSPAVQDEAVNGSGLTVDADGLMLGNLVGNNDVLNDTDNGGTYYGIYGTGNTINATNDGFVDAQSGTLTLQGSGNTLSALASGDTIDAPWTGSVTSVQGTGEVINAADPSDLVNLNGDGSSATVNGQGSIGFYGNDQSATFTGPGSTATVSAGASANINGSNLTINTNAGTSLSLAGNLDTIAGPSSGPCSIDDEDPNTTVILAPPPLRPRPAAASWKGAASRSTAATTPTRTRRATARTSTDRTTPRVTSRPSPSSAMAAPPAPGAGPAAGRWAP